MPTPQDFTVGDAVLYARENAVGLIYEVYERGPGRPGVSLLLSDGRDLGGFSPEEADQFLQRLGHTGISYAFEYVGRLHQDYQRGRFADAFHLAHTLAGLPAHRR